MTWTEWLTLGWCGGIAFMVAVDCLVSAVLRRKAPPVSLREDLEQLDWVLYMALGKQRPERGWRQ